MRIESFCVPGTFRNVINRLIRPSPPVSQIVPHFLAAVKATPKFVMSSMKIKT
jgi:hypothetical protein